MFKVNNKEPPGYLACSLSQACKLCANGSINIVERHERVKSTNAHIKQLKSFTSELD